MAVEMKTGEFKVSLSEDGEERMEKFHMNEIRELISDLLIWRKII